MLGVARLATVVPKDDDKRTRAEAGQLVLGGAGLATVVRKDEAGLATVVHEDDDKQTRAEAGQLVRGDAGLATVIPKDDEDQAGLATVVPRDDERKQRNEDEQRLGGRVWSGWGEGEGWTTDSQSKNSASAQNSNKTAMKISNKTAESKEKGARLAGPAMVENLTSCRTGTWGDWGPGALVEATTEWRIAGSG